MTVMTAGRSTEGHMITVKQAITILHIRRLHLRTRRSGRRFIYQVIDKDGNVASVSSRLDRVVAIAMGRVYA
jgi:hypothetical protein